MYTYLRQLILSLFLLPPSPSQVLLDDVFGTPAEEREAVVFKVPESRSPQSLNSFELLARFLSPSLLPSLLEPVKEVCVCVCVCLSLSLSRRCCRLISALR